MITYRSLRRVDPQPTHGELERAHRDWNKYRQGTAQFIIGDDWGTERPACPSCYARHATDQAIRLSITAPSWADRRAWARHARADHRRSEACQAVARCECGPSMWAPIGGVGDLDVNASKGGQS